jgi:hypothetical protein
MWAPSAARAPGGWSADQAAEAALLFASGESPLGARSGAAGGAPPPAAAATASGSPQGSRGAPAPAPPTASQPPPPPPLPQRASAPAAPHPLVGRSVWRAFVDVTAPSGSRLYRGTVESCKEEPCKAPLAPGAPATHLLFYVRYDDGDEEDIEEHEVRAAMQPPPGAAAAAHQGRAPGAASQGAASGLQAALGAPPLVARAEQDAGGAAAAPRAPAAAADAAANAPAAEGAPPAPAAAPGDDVTAPREERRYRGVSQQRASGEWHVRIRIRNEDVSLGHFATAEEGAWRGRAARSLTAAC